MQAMLTRVVNGFRSLHQSVKLAREVWIAMFVRMAVKPEVYKFSFDIVSALLTHFSHKVPEASWVCMSRLLHKLAKNDCSNRSL